MATKESLVQGEVVADIEGLTEDAVATDASFTLALKGSVMNANGMSYKASQWGEAPEFSFTNAKEGTRYTLICTDPVHFHPSRPVTSELLTIPTSSNSIP